MSATRRSYHHGDLASALVGQATALARAGGPEAVVLREAARRAGVSAAAVYRHFPGHENLLREVGVRALRALGDTVETAVAAVARSDDPAAFAVRRLHALGAAYVGFALAESGLFRTGCRVADHAAADAHHVSRLLGEIFDDIVAAGLLDAACRPDVEFSCRAVIHGFAVLVSDGPPGADRHEAALRRALDLAVTASSRPRGGRGARAPAGGRRRPAGR
jgi:AcrR family transcriptional regulator